MFFQKQYWFLYRKTKASAATMVLDMHRMLQTILEEGGYDGTFKWTHASSWESMPWINWWGRPDTRQPTGNSAFQMKRERGAVLLVVALVASKLRRKLQHQVEVLQQNPKQVQLKLWNKLNSKNMSVRSVTKLSRKMSSFMSMWLNSILHLNSFVKLEAADACSHQNMA